MMRNVEINKVRRLSSQSVSSPTTSGATRGRRVRPVRRGRPRSGSSVLGWTARDAGDDRGKRLHRGWARRRHGSPRAAQRKRVPYRLL